MRKLLMFGLCAVLATSSVADAELLTWLEGNIANEADARIALDSSKHGNHALMAQNTLLTDDGKEGGAFDFGDGTTADTASFMKMNPSTWGRFDGIIENQAFTVAFWMAGEESAVGPRAQSSFWFESPGNVGGGGGSRGIQSHTPWSNGSVFLDIAGCCNGMTQRVSGAVDRALWDATEGEEWTHWTFTMDGDGNTTVFADGEQVLERAGPTTAIAPFQQVWWGSTHQQANSFAGRMDDIVIADNWLDPDQVATLVSDGPSAVWPDDIADSIPTDVLANSEPVAELLKVGGVGTLGELVAGENVDGQFFEIEVSSNLLDSDHLLASDALDMSQAGLKIVAMDDLVPGDSWVPVVGDATGLDSVALLFDDASLWDVSTIGVDGRIVYTGGEAAAVPEPAGFALFGFGLFVLGLLRKQRR